MGCSKEFAADALYPPVVGATVAILDQVANVIAKDPSIGEIVFRLDHVEPPSVELAIELMLDEAASKLRFSCQSESDITPDPRSSRAEFLLWKFDGREPSPAVRPPDIVLVDSCAKIATLSSDCYQSWTRCCEEFGTVPDASAESWLSVMVNPPQNRAATTIVQWLRRVQLAAAQFAVLVERNTGVEIDESKVAEVTRGPLDWSVDAALVALALRARTEHALVPKICRLAQDVLDRIPDQGTWSCKVTAEGVLRFLEITSNDRPA